MIRYLWMQMVGYVVLALVLISASYPLIGWKVRAETVYRDHAVCVLGLITATLSTMCMTKALSVEPQAAWFPWVPWSLIAFGVIGHIVWDAVVAARRLSKR